MDPKKLDAEVAQIFRTIEAALQKMAQVSAAS
jgi:hypothetical protein